MRPLTIVPFGQRVGRPATSGFSLKANGSGRLNEPGTHDPGAVGFDLDRLRQVAAGERDLGALRPAERKQAVGVIELRDLEAIEILRLVAELGIVHGDAIVAGLGEGDFEARIDAQRRRVVVARDFVARRRRRSRSPDRWPSPRGALPLRRPASGRRRRGRCSCR